MIGFFSCQKEDDSFIKQEHTSQTSRTKYSITKIDYQTVQQNNRLVNSITKIKEQTGTKGSSSQNRLVHSSTYDFYIDTDVATYMENANGSYHSYTFPVIRDNPSVALENILFSLQADGTYKVSLVSYNLSESEKEALFNGQFVDLTNKASIETIDSQALIDETLASMDQGNCTTLIITYCSHGNHPEGYDNGSPCPGYEIMFASVCSGGSNTDPDNPDNSDVPDGENNPGGGVPNDTNNNTNDATSPTYNIPYEQNLIECLGLNSVENANLVVSNWINNPDNFIQMRDVSSYVDRNNCSTEAQSFAMEAIEAILEGGEVDFEENRINGIKLDSNLPPCTQNMLLDLMLGNFLYSDTMGNIELINSTFEILGGSYSSSPMGFVTTYKVGEIDGNGQTSPAELDSEGVYQVTVTISENLVENGTKLALIKTILHESIHAYLRYVAKQYPLLFTDPDGEFSTLVAGWQEYQNNNDAHHLYMAELVSEMALNVSNFIQEKYGYPASTTEYYEAVCWSGITHLANGSLNPVFSDNFPNSDDQYHIIKVFNTENGTETYSGYEPLVDNNCN
ncbi:hypothetical protein [Xanthomarina sp.]|uniref:hypothetical protein n=1 Tax=Xanthomarina sp. TaxID=1931211 RepID=UPI002C93E5F7|nr:hypothetical protein [Xanthomarina sp.]HLV38785.1 hypothetical protein [Xanthomarina sp.]